MSYNFRTDNGVEKINKTLIEGGYIYKISPEKKSVSINVVLNKSSVGSIIKCIYKGISQNTWLNYYN